MPKPIYTQAENPLPAVGVEACANEQKVVAYREYIENKEKELLESSCNKLPTWELQRQIEKKQGELLQLLLQMHYEQSSSLKESKQCFEEELLHLLRQFHSKTQHKETSSLDAAARFLCRTGFILAFVSVIAVLRM